MSHNGWHRAIDTQMDTHKYYLSEGTAFGLAFFQNVLEPAPDDEVLSLFRNFITGLYRGDTIYVTSDIQHILMQAAHDLPDEVRADVHTLITPQGFCLFEEPMYGEDRKGKRIGMHGLTWNASKIIDPKSSELLDVIPVYFLTDPSDPNDDINLELTPLLRSYGITIPPLVVSHFYPLVPNADVPKETDERGSKLVAEMLRLFISMQLLAQQRIGEPMKLAPDRATRRRFMREHPELPERLITLITLRRKSVKHDDEDKEPIPWTRRWVVRGHWRRQWYPSLKKHDWKYIYEYIKGPEDKPLVITERRVFNFRR